MSERYPRDWKNRARKANIGDRGPTPEQQRNLNILVTVSGLVTFAMLTVYWWSMEFR